mmetsp:Transcript_21808/g.21978  ORF Transcript_21808/g.21978 Transcript_21808/m.21978 type:complete len:218 (+) Transcript_21808:123-776(+)
MGGSSSSTDWRGTNEEMASMMMPLYYIKECAAVEEDIRMGSETWQKITDGTCKGYLEYKASVTGECDPPLLWFTNVFYTRLFDVNPAAKSLFGNDVKSQTKVLAAIINTALNQLRDPSTYEKTLENLAHVHVKRGVKGVQFGIAGDVLLWSFLQALKDEFHEDSRIVWTKLYSFMLKTLLPVAIGDERDLFRNMKAHEKKKKPEPVKASTYKMHNTA